jgi:hypothetical protein
LILLIMLIPLAAPYLEPGFQFADDRYAPYLRVEAFRSAVADGQIPPRWFAEFDGGYGSPYPSFYAMLFYAVAAMFNLVGLAVGPAVELTAFLTIVAAALAMFVLARGLWGVRAGVLAAALYTYAPYHLVDAFVRGALSELAAFVWFPLVVHTTYQAILTRKKAWMVLSGLTIGGLILTHNLMPIVFLPIMLGILGVIAALQAGDMKTRGDRIASLAASAGLGLLVSAFFWLPIALERGLLRLDYFLQYDFHGDFVGRGTLLAWSSSESPHTSIGMILLGAGIVGALVALWPRSRSSHRLIALGALAAGLAFLFMTTRRSAWIWEHVPLLPFVQFPWRFLAPASFSLALAAGPLPRVVGGGPARWVVVAILGVSVYLQGGPLIRMADRIDDASIEALPVCEEVWGTQDYRPATSQALFWRGPEPPGDPSDPLVLSPCPSGVSLSSAGQATVISSSRNGTHWEVRYMAIEEGVITVPQFYFPGWEAWLDKAPTPVRPSARVGLLEVTVPAGDHTLSLDYADTPARRLGDGLTAVGIVVLLGLAWSARRSQGIDGVDQV